MAVDSLDQSVPFADLTSRVSTDFVRALRPHITGGHAKLFRYGTAAEKTLINLGAYNPDGDTDYDYPSQPADSAVDLSYVKLYAENAKLRYYSDVISSGDTIAPVGGYNNRIRAVATRFKSNTAAARSAAFYDRDVAVGDLAYVTNGSVALWTTVAGFVAEVVAASIASATSGASNQSTQSASSSLSQTAGTVNDVTAVAGVAAYFGLEDGTVNEVYTVTVTQAPTSAGDATTARLSVTSSSGLDNQASVTPSIYGRATRIGTRGATIIFDHTSSDFVVGQVWTLTIAQAFTAVTASSSGTYTGPRNLTYIATVTRGGIANAASSPIANPSTQATVAVTGGGASGGTLPAGDYYVSYSWVTTEGETTVGTSQSAQFTVGATNIPRVTIPALPAGAVAANIYLTDTAGASGTGRLYRRNITTTTVDLTDDSYDGGTFAGSSTSSGTNTATVVAPQITVTDTTGFDASGPTTVGSSLAVSVGSYGVVLTFSGAKLRAGDQYLVTATAASDGAIQTLILQDNLGSTLSGESDLTLKLYIPKNTLIAELRAESPSDANWEADASTFTVKAAMTAFDSTWTNGGTSMALPVEAATLYLEYRAWLTTYTGKVSTLTDPDELEATLGTNHPDNPLCYAVGKALANANDQAVAFTAVADPDDTDDWAEVLTILDRYQNVYGLVPLTRNATVLDAYRSHVAAQSTSDLSAWRVVWTSLESQSSYAVVDATLTSDDATALATLSDNPAVSGTQYTRLVCTSTNAKFVTSGVRAGDTVRYLYGLDDYGDSTWTEFTVASVTNEDELVLETGHSAAVTTAQRFEIYRTRTRSEIASALAAEITADKSNRWMAVWPQTVLDGELEVEGYFLCAALAGLAGGVPPHQSLQNVSISGFSGLGTQFNNAQLNTLEAAGCFTVEIESDGTLYTRSAKTTDQTSYTTGQESAVRTVDAVGLYMARTLRNLYGRTNIVDNDNGAGAVAQVRSELNRALQRMRSDTFVQRLDSLISSGQIVSVRSHALDAGTLVVQMSVVYPSALNAVSLVITSSPVVVA